MRNMDRTAVSATQASAIFSCRSIDINEEQNQLEFDFYVKTDVSPFLCTCPKYASKNYSSCASHILSFCFIRVPSFIEISLTVFKL